MDKPILLLTFSDPERTLKLGEELSEIQKRIYSKPEFELQIHPVADGKSLYEAFTRKENKGRICVLHYAGHADKDQLKFDARLDHGESLIDFLSSQTGLKLVILNACSTENIGTSILDKGNVPLVLATRNDIRDKNAISFAKALYTNLLHNYTIEKSVRNAVEAPEDPSVLSVIARSFDKGNNRDKRKAAYTLLSKTPEDLDWRLGDELEDPYFGLPPLPDHAQSKLPDHCPFIGIRPYDADSALLFFGRSEDIRRLIHDVRHSKNPVTLLYGLSGVGKSSLLAAGLAPRLENSGFSCMYLRREKTGLLPTLQKALASGDLNEGWTAFEAKHGKHLVIILDQVEEALVNGKPEEIAMLATEINSAFGHRDLTGDGAVRKTIHGKLILGYRKEYHAEINDILNDRHIAKTDLYLRPLGEKNIREIVQGIQKNKFLHHKYRWSVADDVTSRITVELGKDASNSLSPVLQLLLTNLWKNTRPDENEERYCTRSVLEKLMEEGIWLEDFVKAQLHSPLLSSFSEHTNSGLILDLLNYFITETVSAKEAIPPEEIFTRYLHTHRDRLSALLRVLAGLNILRAASGTEAYRLSHDTLAPIIRKQYDESVSPGQQAMRLLDLQAKSSHIFSEQDLEVIDKGRQGMRDLNADEKKRVEARKQEIKLHEERNANTVRALIYSELSPSIAVKILDKINRESSTGSNVGLMALNQLLSQQMFWTYTSIGKSNAENSDIGTLADGTTLFATQKTSSLHGIVLVSRFGTVHRKNETTLLDCHSAYLKLTNQPFPGFIEIRDCTYNGLCDYFYVEASSPNSNPMLFVFSSQGVPLHMHLMGIYDTLIQVSNRGNLVLYGQNNVWDIFSDTTTKIENRPYFHRQSFLIYDINQKETGYIDYLGKSITDKKSRTPVKKFKTKNEGTAHQYLFQDDLYILTRSGRSYISWNFAHTCTPHADRRFYGDEIADQYALSPDGQLLVTAFENGDLGLTASPFLMKIIPSGHTDKIKKIIFSPDGKYFITGSDTNILKVWNRDGIEKTRLKGHARSPSFKNLRFSSDGKWLLTNCQYTPIHLWRFEPPVCAERTVIKDIVSIDVSGTKSIDCRNLLIAGNGEVQWTNYLEPVLSIPVKGNIIKALFTREKNETGVIVAVDRRLMIFNSYGDLLNKLSFDSGIISLCANHDRTRYAVSCSGSLHIVNIEKTAYSQAIPYKLMHIVFAGNEQWLAGSDDRSLIIWDIKKRGVILSITLESAIYSISAHPDKPVIAVGLEKGLVLFYNLESGIPVQSGAFNCLEAVDKEHREVTGFVMGLHFESGGEYIHCVTPHYVVRYRIQNDDYTSFAPESQVYHREFYYFSALDEHTRRLYVAGDNSYIFSYWDYHGYKPPLTRIHEEMSGCAFADEDTILTFYEKKGLAYHRLTGSRQFTGVVPDPVSCQVYDPDIQEWTDSQLPVSALRDVKGNDENRRLRYEWNRKHIWVSLKERSGCIVPHKESKNRIAWGRKDADLLAVASEREITIIKDQRPLTLTIDTDRYGTIMAIEFAAHEQLLAGTSKGDILHADFSGPEPVITGFSYVDDRAKDLKIAAGKQVKNSIRKILFSEKRKETFVLTDRQILRISAEGSIVNRGYIENLHSAFEDMHLADSEAYLLIGSMIHIEIRYTGDLTYPVFTADNPRISPIDVLPYYYRQFCLSPDNRRILVGYDAGFTVYRNPVEELARGELLSPLTIEESNEAQIGEIV